MSEKPAAADPVELGNRIAASRKARGLTQDEVAKHLGVSRPTLVAMEKGTRAARPEEIHALAGLFGRTVHELVSSRPVVSEFAPQFRVTQATGFTRDQIGGQTAEFQRLCEDYVALEALVNAPLPRRYPEPYEVGGLSAQAAAEEVAESERLRLNLGDDPLSDIFNTLETDVGLRLFVVPLSEPRVAGMFAFTDELGGCILVNGIHPHTRQRWSCAHEFGHFLCNRYQSEITVLLEYERKPRSEQFADFFAGCFLMPASGLRRRFRAILQSRGDFTVADLYRLAEQYGVSVEAMTRRLEMLGLVARGMWERLSAKLDVARGRSYLGLGRSQAERVRLPERYRRLAVEAYERELISEGELARLLRCSRVEAREAVEDLTTSGEVDASGQPVQLRLDFGESLQVA